MEIEKMKKKTGTTTVGLVYSDGVVLGADMKATMGYLVASKESKKILQLDKHIAMTIAGMEGDAQALERFLKAELKLYRLQEGKAVPVKAAATLLSNILHSSRYYPYFVQLVVGGYDTAPRLFSLDPSGANEEEKKFFSSGSGSPMAFGVLENSYKEGMTEDDAKKLVARAIRAAIERDIASGGKGINLVVINSRGLHTVPEEEVKKLL